MAEIIDMPKLSDTMSVGTLVKWNIKEGQVVAFGDILAEVETDKATMELSCTVPGTVLKIYARNAAARRRADLRHRQEGRGRP
jgi:pyruvate dehydrogenase E2 component (dihydrolipoamide acetyltransferase)